MVLCLGFFAPRERLPPTGIPTLKPAIFTPALAGVGAFPPIEVELVAADPDRLRAIVIHYLSIDNYLEYPLNSDFQRFLPRGLRLLAAPAACQAAICALRLGVILRLGTTALSGWHHIHSTIR